MCLSVLELEITDLIPKKDTCVEGHTYYTYICEVCKEENTAYWGMGGDAKFLPGSWMKVLQKL